MKKFLLSFGVIGAFIIYAIFQNGGNSSYYSALKNAQPAPPQEPPSLGPGQPSETFGMPMRQVMTSPIIGAYKDGTYTGSIADAYYGNVQVRATIQNGRITNVIFLDYPHDRGNSIAINSYAMPLLKQEAIRAQIANVNVVSGATETSSAFRESLANALAQSKN